MAQKHFDPLSWIDNELDQIKEQDLLRKLSIRESPHVAGKVQIDGQPYIDFGSNDYLSLSAHPKLVESIKSNAGYVGWGSGASPLIHGRGTLHARLERRIAEFEDTESSLTFTSGFAANVGAITSLVGQGDVVFSDAKNHASIIDGCRLSGAQIVVYRHCDADHLNEVASQYPESRRKLIVTDGLFSMDGDLAPLGDIVQIAGDVGAMLLVDEAHATGIFGQAGKGVSEYLGVKSRVDVVVGTLSKAIGCHGGFVAGSKKLVEWMTNKARSYVFSTAVPDATCMAAVAALDLVANMSEDRAKLLENAANLRERLRSNGYNVGSSQSQIIPVVIGNNQAAMRCHEQLKEKGMFVPAIRPPSVPDGESMLRISLNTGHSEAMIDKLVNGLTEVER